MTPPAADSTPKVTGDARRSGWAKAAPWIFGILVLSALVAFVLHRGEVERFAQLARSARPAWLLLACAAQAATYFSLAAVWWRTLWCAGHRLDYWSLVPLSVAKLFTDQAVPTGGVSGILLVVKGLNRRGVPSDVAAGNMVVGIVSFYAAYILVVLASIAVMWLHGRVNHTVLIAVSAFGAFAVAVPGAVLALRRWSKSRAANWIRRFKPVRRLMDAMAGAPMGLLRKPVMMAQVTAL